VDVTNTGSRAGTDTVQLYSHERQSREKQPDQQLRGFGRITLAPHQTGTVTITLPASQLAFWDYTQDKSVVETGTYDLAVGDSATHTPLSAPLSVRGQVIPPRDLTRATQAQDFDDYSGVTLTDTSKANGTSVASTAAGQWISLADSEFGRGVRGLTASVADEGAATSVQIRLDDPATGPVVGTLAVPATGDHYAYTTVHTALAPITGRHTVYLVFNGSAEMSTFQFTR
jgi:beta-glucosidase